MGGERKFIIIKHDFIVWPSPHNTWIDKFLTLYIRLGIEW